RVHPPAHLGLRGSPPRFPVMKSTKHRLSSKSRCVIVTGPLPARMRESLYASLNPNPDDGMSNDEIYVDADEVRSFANRFGQLINTSYRPQLDKISDEIEDTESSDDPESSAVDEAGVEA